MLQWLVPRVSAKTSERVQQMTSSRNVLMSLSIDPESQKKLKLGTLLTSCSALEERVWTRHPPYSLDSLCVQVAVVNYRGCIKALTIHMCSHWRMPSSKEGLWGRKPTDRMNRVICRTGVVSLNS